MKKNYDELEKKFKLLSEDYDKLVEKCLDLEMIIANGKQETEIVKDYTKVHGSEITPDELDKVKLIFSDQPTYIRLMTEYQLHENSL